MTVLTVRLFGPFQVYLNGEPVKGFRSDKARALLAYLCTEEMRPHRREKLAGLLWPDVNEQSARANLRYALANLRHVLGDQTGSRETSASSDFLITTPQTIQLNPTSDFRIDVATFSVLTCQLRFGSQVKQDPLILEQAVDSFHGEFLEGFFLHASPVFEEWVLLNRERFHRLVMESLHQLAEYYRQTCQYERALPFALHHVELDPWQETAHRQVMRLLALSGQRAKALIQFETCRRILSEELEIEPDEETRGLYQQILQGDLKTYERARIQATPQVVIPPSFLQIGSPVRFERQLLFARESELAQLDKLLESALSGSGQVVFVSGEAGSGKTALISEFANRASETHGNLISVRGNCNSHTGVGDPYLPFREILGLLTGDVESRWNARTIPREYALRLWNNLPLIVPVLLEHGRGLIETLLPADALIERVKAGLPEQADWITDLAGFMNHKAAFLGGHPLTQDALIEQFASSVRALAGHKPLLILLDDLQWADQGSINLLSYLGTHINDTSILVIGAYRSEELSLGRNSEQHPLLPVIHKFRRTQGEITIDLEQAEGLPFIEALIESEPNQLGADFRKSLYELTKGHPLFSIELLRGMQERGDLIKDSQGRWTEGPVLNWEELPARLEAAIADRIERLSSLEQTILRIASVEGEVFTAEVIGRVGKLADGEMVTLLSSELDRKHRLIRAQGTTHINDQRFSRYRFRHILFQKYLYTSLDRIEKEHLHEAVGTALETLLRNQSIQITQIAPQLARHFQEAGMSIKAVGYHYQAGERAVHLSANEEGMFHYYQGLKLLATLPDLPEFNQQELKILVALTVPLLAIKGYISPELDAVVKRASVLVRKVGGARDLMGTLLRLFLLNSTHGEHQVALEFAQRLASVAQENQDGIMEAIGFHAQGIVMFSLGEFKQALSHFEKAINFYDPSQHSASAFIMGQDLGVAGLCWATQSLWMLGYPDQAMLRSQQAIALAQTLDHKFSLGYTLSLAGSMIHQLRNDITAAHEGTAKSLAFVNKYGFAFLQAYNLVVMGWAQAEIGCAEEGIAQILTGLARHKEMNARIHLPHYQALLARSYTLAGNVDAGLEVANTTLALVEETGERYYEAELQRLKGELLAAQGNEAGAEACFLEAIQVARQQSAKSWELRSTTSLARLWQKQGKWKEALLMMSEIYGWFSEGFDSPDLKEARSLLSELN
jgi:DNA-binding SARP family transcriptional activator/predicted ATPase